MTRPPMSDAARQKMERFHPEVVDEVNTLLGAHRVVVVGMGWNPHVKRARQALDGAGVEHAYHEIGNYAGQWNPRLAIKMWSGWPTFPQVFVDGTLLGGADETEAALKAGELTA